MTSIDFDKLVKDVIENPELISDPSTITDEQLFELQKKINPYVNLNDSIPGVKQAAICSYTNLREDYIKRFTMTSMISFIYQLLDEYEVPKEQRLWKPVTYHSHTMFNAKGLREQLESICNILKNVEELEEKEKYMMVQNNFEELTGPDIYKLKCDSTAMMFTVTNMVKDIGVIADYKLNVTLAEAIKYPEIKNIINAKKHTADEFTETEFPDKLAKEIIHKFLNNFFSFDPSIHIRNGIDTDKIKEEIKVINNQEIQIDPDDPGHLTYDALRQKIKVSDCDKEYMSIIMSQKRNYNAAVHILRDENLHDSIIYMLQNKEQFSHYLLPVRSISSNIIPPQDTFHRWNYFTEVNYEEIRTLTECLYPERPDLDWAVAIWNVLTGNTQEELDEQFNMYCQKHQDELPSVIKLLEIGKWCLLADFKENRKNIQFYNKNTEVLKRIIDRHTEDKKIGTELMRNRVRQAKAKNIAEVGPDAPGLKTYKNTMSSDGKDLVSKGVEKVITPEEMKRLEKASGNLKAAKELEVIEEYESILRNLDDIKKYRELNPEEISKYKKASEVIKQAKEMLNVPDEAIQVDVFTSNPKTGEFVKSHFYTKCDEVLE
jgi:hypothetical protein